jgi:hypothetical protein
MSKLVRSTIVSIVNLVIKLMLPGNQQEIVALTGILEFFITQGRTRRDITNI